MLSLRILSLFHAVSLFQNFMHFIVRCFKVSLRFFVDFGWTLVALRIGKFKIKGNHKLSKTNFLDLKVYFFANNFNRFVMRSNTKKLQFIVDFFTSFRKSYLWPFITIWFNFSLALVKRIIILEMNMDWILPE